MADKNYIFKRVKEVVYSYDLGAQVVLYGSRARESATEESDWDFLILTDIDVDHEKIFTIHHSLYEIEWETGEVITSIIHSKSQWHRQLNQVTPFYQNVEREGIYL